MVVASANALRNEMDADAEYYIRLFESVKVLYSIIIFKFTQY